MASARIAKYPPIAGVGLDMHMVAPPITPPPPPTGPNPVPFPTYNWAVTIGSQISGFALTGKWSWYRVTTEGVGNILAGHDWGMGQAHLPVPPLVSPSIAIRTLSSSVKYWLPSTPNQDPKDGSSPGGPGSVAISFPAWCIPTQDCQDASGWPFNLPTSVSFQIPSTREVGFTWGDLVNGLINMAADSAASLIGRWLGGPPGPLRDAISGAAINGFINHMTGLLPPEAQNAGKVVIAGAFVLGLGKPPADVVGAMVGPAADWAAGAAGGAAQEGIDDPRAKKEEMGHGGTPLFE